MDKILFFAHLYWEIHWMYDVIKKLDGVVYTDDDQTKQLCIDLGIKTTNSYDDYKALVMCVLHMGQNYEMAKKFNESGRKIILMQHAWDPALNLCDHFWDLNMQMFDYYLVGCEQDYQWLSQKFGDEKILNLGIPKLDNLYRIKNKEIDLSDIYNEVGTNDFFLSLSPTNVLSDGVYRDYAEHLVPNSPTTIVFKLHPGSTKVEETRVSFLNEGKDFKIIADKINDPNYVYKVIKASKGVVCLESFLSVEASLLGKPVIFHGHDSLNSDFYNKSENINQIERAPLGMSSSLGDPHYKDEQKNIADMYQFDGKSTYRVVTFLKGLYNTL